MAIIDLDTGIVEAPEKTPVQGRIIDLETGGYIEPTGTVNEQFRENLRAKQQVDPQTTEGATGPADLIQQQREQQTPLPGRESRATEELPEITASGLLADEDPKKVAGVASLILVTPSPEEIGKILTSTFPHIGITEDEKGNLIANNNNTGVQAVINQPGASLLDLYQALGITAAFTPSAGLASAPTTALARATVAGGSAGVTQGVIEALQQASGGEFNEDEMAIASSLGFAAELVLPTIQALRKSKLQKQAELAGQEIDQVKASIQTADEAAQATGVDLFPAQRTTISADLQAQDLVQLLPAGTAKASKQLAKQNQQAAQAVDDFLRTVAPDTSIVTGPDKFRKAAQLAAKQRNDLRSSVVRPVYKAAFENANPVDLTPVNNAIDDLLTKFAPGTPTHKELMEVRKALNPKTPLTLEQLQNVKIDLIDQKLDSFGQGSPGRIAKRNLTRIKTALTEELEKSNPLFVEANKRFEEVTKSLNASAIVDKVAGMDDTQLKNISRRIFDPAETNPQVIRNAKKIINNADPEAWNELFRTEIERRLGSVRSTLESGTTENVPGQLYNAVFGNTKQRNSLYAAVDGDMKQNLKYLETVLNRAKLGRVTGSPTATREEIKRELRGGPANFIRHLFTTNPLQTVGSATSAVLTGATAEAGFNARVRALADVLFDPNWQPRMRMLRQLPTDSPAAVRAMAQLLDDAISADLENLEDAQSN